MTPQQKSAYYKPAFRAEDCLDHKPYPVVRGPRLWSATLTVNVGSE